MEQCYSSQFVGNMVDSKTTLQATKGDDKNAIFAVAVLDGATSKSCQHPGHTLRAYPLYMDEATDTPKRRRT